MATDKALRVELITRDFNRMLAELLAIDPTVEFRDVVMNEALAVTQTALNSTRAAKVASIRAAYRTKEYTTFNGKKYKLSNRYPDALWQGIKEMRDKRLEDRLNARGIAKQSWTWVAGAMGGKRLKAPAYVDNANYKGRQFNDGAAFERGTSTEFELTILNISPVAGPYADGERALLRGIIGRTRFFEINMEKRAFRTFEERAKKYPGIFVTP